MTGKPRYEYEVQGYYRHGWEVVTTEVDREEARARLWEYRAEEPETSFRVVRISVAETDLF